MMNWTTDQKKAIDTQNSNLLVAAGAGSGKTAVLVERVIKKITHGMADIEHLLIATFTEAAASEMKEKIYNAVLKEVEKNPGNKQLLRQLSLVPSATITTIHSFCLDIIKNNYALIGLEPDFSVADENESKALKEEALLEVIEELYDKPDFIALADFFSRGRNDNGVVDAIRQVYDFVINLPEPEKSLDIYNGFFDTVKISDIGKTVWCKEIYAVAEILINECIEITKQCIDEIGRDINLDNYLPAFISDQEGLIKIKDGIKSGFTDFAENLSQMKFERLKSIRYNLSADRIKARRDFVKKTVNDLKSDFLFMSDLEVMKDISKLKPIIYSLCEAVKMLDERFLQKKRDKGVLDFNDFEHLALKILYDDSGNPSDVANCLKEKYTEIFLDEYQDTNYIQEKIFKSISRGNNLFMVGDMKQSIYSFRNANPEIFTQKYKTYTQQNSGNMKVCLFKNFRSRDGVLNFVNSVFSRVMTEFIGDVDYTQEEYLNCGADYSADGEGMYVPEIDIIENPRSTGEDKEPSVDIEARFVANRIKQLINSKLPVRDGDRIRPVRYGDIAILLRTEAGRSEIFARELSLREIPVSTTRGESLFNAPEVKVAVAMLKIIDNPMQDIELIAVMRSPMFSFFEDELLTIRLNHCSTSFYGAVKAEAEAGNKKCIHFLEILKQLREMKNYVKVDELIYAIYNKTGYLSFVSALENGETRRENLLCLFDRARQFEKSSFKGLYSFVNYIERLRAGEAIISRGSTDTNNSVKIMSIHKSKGLEFPVVFLCNANKRYNEQDLNKHMIIHRELGLCPDFTDADRHISYPTIAKTAAKTRMKIESKSEELRVLYVAMTRAREKLFITGSVTNLPNAVSKWKNAYMGNRVSRSYMFSASNYLDVIGPSLLNCNNTSEQTKEMSGGDFEDFYNDNIKVNTHTVDDISSFTHNFKKQQYERISDAVLCNCSDIDENNLVFENLEYEYPYKKACSVLSKISVVELKQKKNNAVYKDIKFNTPLFISGKGEMTGAEKGTALHQAMQFIDYNKTGSVDEINQELDRLCEKMFISKQQRDVISAEKIYGFFNSKLGERLKASEEIKREQRFFIEEKSADLYDESTDETVIVQGIIDCYFKEGDSYVLLDFKTDISTHTDHIKESYRVQIETYKRAIEKLTGIPVSESFIYLFSIDNFIKI